MSDSDKAVAVCLGTILTDEPWRDFGFSRRPVYGAFFQRFRSKWRVKLEKTVLQQMFCALIAGYVVSGKSSKESIAASLVKYMSARGVATTAFGFSSQEECVRCLKSSIEEFVSSPPRQWSSVLSAHIRPDLLPDKKLATLIRLGCIQFGDIASSLILRLRNGADEV